MRVLLVATHPVQYAAPLYRRYAADGRIDLTVAYCSLQGAVPGIDPDFGVELAWDVPLLNGYRWAHPRNYSPRPGLRHFWGLINPGLWRLVRDGDFDVVVCFGYRAASFWIAAMAAKRYAKILVFTSDGWSFASRNGKAWKVFIKKIVVPRIFHFADAVFAPSNRTVKFFQSLNISDDSIVLTPYVVDNRFFASRAAEADTREIRRTWNVPLDATVALLVGKLVTWKRPGDLIVAAAAVDDLHVVIAGDGPLRTQLELMARAHGISDRVRFLGFVNQSRLPEVYAAADFLVVPSEYEPFGLVVNEAFACGIPAIVTKACGSSGDLVREGETGYVISVGDIRALTNRLERLRDNPILRSTLGDRARRRIREWGPDQNVGAFVNGCFALFREEKHRAVI